MVTSHHAPAVLGFVSRGKLPEPRPSLEHSSAGPVDDVVAAVLRTPREEDVERPQEGVEPGILDRENVGWLARLVVVRVPEARRRDEGRMGLPVDPDAVLDADCLLLYGCA
jgi:hypothetical protein